MKLERFFFSRGTDRQTDGQTRFRNPQMETCRPIKNVGLLLLNRTFGSGIFHVMGISFLRMGIFLYYDLNLQ